MMKAINYLKDKGRFLIAFVVRCYERNYGKYTMMNWPDVYLVVRTIIESEIHLEDISINDAYDIEKATNFIFEKVRLKQLENKKEVRS